LLNINKLQKRNTLTRLTHSMTSKSMMMLKLTKR